MFFRLLNDKRILTIQRYSDEKGNYAYKLCIYSTINGDVCDINIDIEEIKNNKLDYQQLMQSNSSKKMKKWNKMLDEQGINIVNNMKKIQIEANIMNNKASNINQILKLESNNNPKNDELKKEATNYYINSIQAKLQVLNKISSS